MAAREYLLLAQESLYGVPVTVGTIWPTASPNCFFIRLDGSNSFTMRPKQVILDVPSGGGRSTPGSFHSDHILVEGELKTPLYGSIGGVLLDWAATPVSSGSVPWTNTDTTGDLASMTAFHAIQRSDGTYRYRAYPGCKVTSWKIEVSRDSTIAHLTLGLVAQKMHGNTYDSSGDPTSGTFQTTTLPWAFPVPTETEYPTDIYKFSDTKGAFTVGSSRTNFSSLSVQVVNKIDSQLYENHYLSVCQFLGRNSQLTARFQYKPTPDDRTAYEALTTQTTSLEFNNGTNTLTIDYKGNNIIHSLDDDLPLDKIYDQTMVLQNYWSQSAGTDISISHT